MQANRNSVFISAPINLDWSTVMNFAQTVKNKGANVYFWDRQRQSKYDQEKFDYCDTVIFLLPDNKCEAGFRELPVGLKAELRRAYSQSKNILIGYKADSGKYYFYDTETNGQYIKRICGTVGALDRIVEKTEKAKDELQNLSWIGKRVRGFEECSSVTYLRRLGEIGKVRVYDPSEDSICVEFLDGTTLWYSAEKAKKYIVESRTDDVMRIVNNSTYGLYATNPCAEIKLPKGPIGSVGHKGTPGVDGIEFDERLLLML